MRILITLQAKQDQVYQQNYHHKLRGRIWRALEESQYDYMHDDPETRPFVFSNPFPRTDYEEGDTANVLVSSLHDGLIQTLQSQIEENTEFNIGEMAFDVVETDLFAVDVGEPGSTGSLRCHTGFYLPLYESHWSEYNIDVPYDTDRISWAPEHGQSAMRERIVDNITEKVNDIYPPYINTPEKFTDVFTGMELGDTYPMPVKVTEDYEYTFVVTTATFDYTVQNDTHRKWLNTLLRTGLGYRNSLGFGFLNKM